MLMLVLLLGGVSLSLGASFVVEKSEIRVKAPGFAATYPSAIGDVSSAYQPRSTCTLPP